MDAHGSLLTVSPDSGFPSGGLMSVPSSHLGGDGVAEPVG